MFAAVGWIIVGIALMGAAVWFAMPPLMLLRRSSHRSYDDTVEALKREFEKLGDWRVVTVHDYQEKTAPFAAIERTGSINICNPRYAARILAHDSDRGVTAFMPLAVGVYEEAGGRVYVSRLNVGLMGRMFGGTIAEVMGAAGRDLQTAITAATSRPEATSRSSV